MRVVLFAAVQCRSCPVSERYPKQPPQVWKSVSPQSLVFHSVRERQRLQFTQVVKYEQQSFTVTNAVGGTFRIRFEGSAAVSACSLHHVTTRHLRP